MNKSEKRTGAEELESSSEIPKMEEREVTRGGATYTQDTSNIGGSSDSKPSTGDGSPSPPR